MNLKKYIVLPLLCVPLVAFGISVTKECARQQSDVVLEGSIISLESYSAKHGTNTYDLTCAHISITNVIKGSSVTNGCATVYYKTQPSNTFKCPPYVTLEVGDTGTFAATTNLQEMLKIELFIYDGDHVDIRTDEFKNANK